MTTLMIPDMSCGHRKATVEKTIKNLDPAAVLAFDMPARRVAVQSTAPVDALRSALQAAGYAASAA